MLRYFPSDVRRRWRKLAKKCRWRVFDMQRDCEGSCLRPHRGNPLCSMGCLGRRCTCGIAGCEQMPAGRKRPDPWRPTVHKCSVYSRPNVEVCHA